MQEAYVMILVSLNPDHTDLSGIRYPNSGYIESQSFRADQNIMHGLYGTLWGKTKTSKWLNTDPLATWHVVRTSRNEELIVLDSEENLVKFRAGMVVQSGSKNKCVNYICDRLDLNLSEDILARHRVVPYNRRCICTRAPVLVSSVASYSGVDSLSSARMAKVN